MYQNNFFIFSYGFFLVWLTGFLYNGPLLKLVVNEGLNKYLAATYIVVPGLLSFIISFSNRKIRHSNRRMYGSVLICTILTLAMLIDKVNSNIFLMYLFAAILGICSIIYIAEWGYCFVNNLEMKEMLKIMGLTICLGKGIFYINELLASYNMIYILRGIVLISLPISLYFTMKIKTENQADYKEINDYKNVFFPLVATMFFVNISGGFVLAFIFDDMKRHLYNYYFDIVMHLTVAAILIKINYKRQDKNITTLGLVILSIGMILFIFPMKITELISYSFVSLGFLMIDIIIWTMVAKLGYITKKPYTIFYGVMGSNLMAVFLGNIIFMLVNNMDTGFLISAIALLISFLSAQYMFQKFDKLDMEFNNRNYYVTNIDMSIFTEREKEIVVLMCQNFKNLEIAEQLYISENTLKTHAKNIYAKLNVKNKKELIELNEKSKLR